MRLFQTILLISAILATANSHAQVTIKIIDQDNNPVQNAIVSLVIVNDALNTVGATTEAITSNATDTQFKQTTSSSIAVMDQIAMQFEPRVMVIEQGQSVHFPNSDNIRHHVYSFSPTNPFEIKLYSGQPTSPIAFQQPGLAVLGCNIHDQMKGFIYITATNEISAVSDASGLLSVPTISKPLTIWHERLGDGLQRYPLNVELDKTNGNRIATIELRPAVNSAQRTFRRRYQ